MNDFRESFQGLMAIFLAKTLPKSIKCESIINHDRILLAQSERAAVSNEPDNTKIWLTMTKWRDLIC
jgi:hypothetical protein